MGLIIIIIIFIFTYDGRAPKGRYTINYICNVLYDVMYPKITSKTCLTGNTAHDCHKIKVEHDIIDKPVKPVHNLLVRLK